MTVDEALEVAAETVITGRDSYFGIKVLAEEVKRLRQHTATMAGGLRNAQDDFEAISAEVTRLRQATHVYSVNEGRLQARIAELETLLLRQR